MTIDNIVDDILLTLRNHNISESESISRRQIELWILSYSSLLKRQEVDKGNYIADSMFQDIVLDMKLDNNVSYGGIDFYRLVSTTNIPKTIDISSSFRLSGVFDMSGNEIQIMSKRRSDLQYERKYTGRDYTAYINGSKLYLNGDLLLDKVIFRSIFDDPYAVPGFNNDSEFPLSPSLIPALKALILDKELRILAPTDNINNSNNDTENINGNQAK